MSLWGNKDQAADKPKFLSTAEKAVTVGVDIAEAVAGRAKGLRLPGWNTHRTYTDAQGKTRVKTECLVAMSSMTLDAEDTVAVDLFIKINTQPVAQSVVAGATATFSLSAQVMPSGSIATYQWQVQDTAGTTWTNVGTNAPTYTTGVTSVVGDNGDKYRCVLTATNALPVTSKAVKLTVTAA